MKKLPQRRSTPDDARKGRGRGCPVPIYGALALIALAITGCATTHSYTPTYCLTKGQLETLKGQEPPKVKSGLSGKADHDLEVVAGSAIRLRAWGDGLITVLGGCVDPNKP